jgi:hypothetical protein
MTKVTRIAALATAALLAGAVTAQAVVVDGDSSGVFSNVQILAGGGTVGQPSSNQLIWPNVTTTGQSTLTAVAFPFSNDFPVPSAGNLQVGQLNWFNASSAGNVTPDKFSADLTWTVDYDNPSAASDSELFSITVENFENPTADDLTGLVLSIGDFGAPKSLGGGVTITGYYLALLGPGSYVNGIWTNEENTTSQMGLFAQVQVVPLPAAAWLLLAGIGGLGLASRRRKADA